MSPATVYLALGSNLGDRAAQLARGIAALERRGVRVRRRSPIYETEPVGVAEQPPFLNQVVEARTGLSPLTLLEICKGVEQAVGRRPGPRWGPRPLDVDIILYNGVRLDSPELVLPHPRFTQRLFVLRPLADLRPDLVLPDGTPILVQIERLEGGPWVRRLPEPPAGAPPS